VPLTKWELTPKEKEDFDKVMRLVFDAASILRHNLELGENAIGNPYRVSRLGNKLTNTGDGRHRQIQSEEVVSLFFAITPKSGRKDAKVGLWILSAY